jgi:hypothetical protein
MGGGSIATTSGSDYLKFKLLITGWFVFCFVKSSTTGNSYVDGTKFETKN